MTQGICHLCRLLPEEPKVVPIEYCPVCDHWFCEECKTITWKHVWDRGVEAVKQIANTLRGVPHGNCCGPAESEKEAA